MLKGAGENWCRRTGEIGALEDLLIEDLRVENAVPNWGAACCAPTKTTKCGCASIGVCALSEGQD